MKKIATIFLFALFNISVANAASITFQLGGFIGRYNISGGLDNTGDKVINLSPGNYTFSAKFGGTTNFTVHSDGTVTSSDSAILSYSGSTLTLNTLPIYFDIGSYNNKYTISSSVYQGTSGTLYLPAKLAVSIDVPGSNAVATIISDPNGFVSVTSGAEKVLGSKNKVFFKTVAIKVDPGVYDGIYAFNGGTYIAGVTMHQLFPNTSYTLRTSTAYNIGNIQTNSTHLVDNTTANLRTLNDTVSFYSNQYTITPPSGYNSVWYIYQQGSNTGVGVEWLLPNMQSRLIAGGVVYNFIADANCGSFTVSTAVGVFDFACDGPASLVHTQLSSADFNDRARGYILNRTDGRLSTTIGDYALSVNGSSHALSDYQLTNDTLEVYYAFSEGRNAIVLDGEDSDSNTFQVTPVYWAGSGEVHVITSGATDTVTLEVEQVIGVNTYNKIVSKQAVDHLVIFKNVPRIDDGFVDISSGGGSKKIFRSKIAAFERIYFR